ncbi:MAG: SgcJ/EcaC family oxidoreductase [Sphingomonas sp.]
MGQQAGPADITARFEAAWNAHDMQAFGALFHSDATFVNRFATYWRGIEQIIAGHAAIHGSIYRDSVLEVDVPDVDPIGEDAAILHFWTRLSAGAAHPAGPHQCDTLILAVVTRRDGAWRIQAAENVTLLDPMTRAEILRP